ncbi:MAG: B3/4 domain-containing protein [Atopobiaceae bacterium]
MDFIIDPEVHKVLPTLCVGIVEAHGIDNSKAQPQVDAMLDEAIADAKSRLDGRKASDDPRVQPYRKAFHALGMSPSRYPSSNIALLRRIAKGKGMYRINPIVDLGNAISIGYGLPLGAHAMLPDQTLELRFSRSDDVFVVLGATEPDPTLQPGELVYAVDNLVHTRRWTWRQSQNGSVTQQTHDVLFPIDGFMGQNDADVQEACDDLATRLRDVFHCEATARLVS